MRGSSAAVGIVGPKLRKLRATPARQKKQADFAGYSPNGNSLRFPEKRFAPGGEIRFDAACFRLEILRFGVEERYVERSDVRHEGELRELLLWSEPFVRGGRLRTLRDVPPGAPGRPPSPQPAAVRIPPGAPAPGGV